MPYDSAVQLTRHIDLQAEGVPEYRSRLPGRAQHADLLHLTPENSWRLRALAAWASLKAYGADGYREIVEANCACAALLGERIAESLQFRLRAPVRMNVVSFHSSAAESVPRPGGMIFLGRLRDSGQGFFRRPPSDKNTPGMRAAFSNWRTTPGDVPDPLSQASAGSRHRITDTVCWVSTWLERCR